jgi:hypothetical protein
MRPEFAETGVLWHYECMKSPDLDRERSEASRSLADFQTLYNENLPATFPRASKALLEEYRDSHMEAFKVAGVWSLDVHRKRVMDWLRTHAPIEAA